MEAISEAAVAKQYFIFGRISGKGNPWSIEVKHPLTGRADAKADLRHLARVKGRDTKLVHVEAQVWTAEAIASLQTRGILPA